MNVRDNYEIALIQTRGRFLRYDQETMIEKFSLDADSKYLYLEFVSRPYRIDRKTGAIETLQNVWMPVTYEDGMTIYDILCDAKPYARVSGSFQNAWNQKNVSNAPNGSMFQSTADFFSGHCEMLSRACERLNGRKVPFGDVGYDIPVFQDLCLRILFWDQDDEFPANLNLQWDKNILDFMRYETTFYAAGFVLKRLRSGENHERGLAESD